MYREIYAIQTRIDAELEAEIGVAKLGVAG